MLKLILLAVVLLVYLGMWSLCLVARWEDDAQEALLRRLHQVPDRKRSYPLVKVGP